MKVEVCRAGERHLDTGRRWVLQFDTLVIVCLEGNGNGMVVGGSIVMLW